MSNPDRRAALTRSLPPRASVPMSCTYLLDIGYAAPTLPGCGTRYPASCKLSFSSFFYLPSPNYGLVDCTRFPSFPLLLLILDHLSHMYEYWRLGGLSVHFLFPLGGLRVSYMAAFGLFSFRSRETFPRRRDGVWASGSLSKASALSVRWCAERSPAELPCPAGQRRGETRRPDLLYI